jgi:hypothetical protein
MAANSGKRHRFPRPSLKLTIPNLAAVVYGTITVGALLAAESASSETYPETIAAVVLALLVYWLAHSYSGLTEYRLAQHKALTLRDLAHTLGEELMILVGAGVPLLVLVICWIAGVSLNDAVTAAIWTSAAMIVVVEVFAGIRAKLSGKELAIQAALGTLFGFLVISLRFILH